MDASLLLDTTIVANMSFAGRAFGPDRTIELTLRDSADKDWGLLIEELQQLRLSLNGRVLDRDLDNSIIVTILDLNDNEPTFIGEPYIQEVIELTPVGSTIFRRLTAEDPDSNENGRVSYQIEGPNENFEIPLPSTGDIVLKRSLDYEGFQPGEEKKYLIPVVAHDLAADVGLRQSSSTTVTIIVTDGDDQAVQFLPRGSPPYVSSVMENRERLNQPLTFNPAPIYAVDLDTDVQGPPGIVYSFLAGSPSEFRDYFDIDGPTGNITLKKPVERAQVEEFIITIKAEQDDNPVRYATADVKISVEDNDVNKPYFFISTGESGFKGYVRQFTGQAAIVLSYDESPLLLEVRDDDFTDNVVPKGSLRYELTDTSGRFDVIDTGYLIVNANWLDIDTQKEYRMTVRAVETTTSRKLSTDELTVVVTVLNGTGDDDRHGDSGNVEEEEAFGGTPFGVEAVAGAAVGGVVAGLLLGVAVTLLTLRFRSLKSKNADPAEEEYVDVRTPGRAASQRSGTGSDAYSYPMAPLAVPPPLPPQPNSHYQELRPAVYQSLERP
ncbi:PREDICTED: protocadherin-15-like [Branchiostoma belcheri]|uniref:Protocadherin-15-like n=1 Tax=Branchiostoma belcheri TaxID=7741 RepID=A0A6P4XJW7_BRABE|nr:PREDICTED: protocadherin-15-like [Branchiostoma belcheri]